MYQGIQTSSTNLNEYIFHGEQGTHWSGIPVFSKLLYSGQYLNTFQGLSITTKRRKTGILQVYSLQTRAKLCPCFYLLTQCWGIKLTPWGDSGIQLHAQHLIISFQLLTEERETWESVAANSSLQKVKESNQNLTMKILGYIELVLSFDKIKNK